MSLTLILVTILFGLISIYFWLIKYRQSYFKRRGIPGPDYDFLFGHFKTIWGTKSFSRVIQNWTQQYGSIYGILAGQTPVYVTSDVDFIQEVYVKQFSSFNSRNIEKILQIQTDGNVHLFRSSGATWRRQRHVINPSFSSAKLKLMSSLVNQCIDAMLEKVSQVANSENPSVNIYELYKRLTMDVICKKKSIFIFN